MCMCLSDLCLIILSVFFPPLPVWIRRGVFTSDSFINILLFILGYFPGLIHSWYIIAKYPPGSHHDQNVIYIYRSDLENQTPQTSRSQRRAKKDRSRDGAHQEQLITQEPHGNPQITYGSMNEGRSSEVNSAPPPAYTELDNDHKVQH